MLWPAVAIVAAGLPFHVNAQLTAHRTTFWIKAFIPEQHPTLPDVLIKADDGNTVVRAPPAYGFDVAGRCFSTDNRTRSPEIGEPARLHHQFDIVTKGRNLTIENEVKKVGPSHLVDCKTGAIEKSMSASLADMTLSIDRTRGRSQKVVLSASSGNPFFELGGVNVAPKIDWSVIIEYDVLAKSFKVNYAHGCFPAFEMYAKSEGSMNTLVIFQDDIQNDCTPMHLIDAAMSLNTVSGQWGPVSTEGIAGDSIPIRP